MNTRLVPVIGILSALMASGCSKETSREDGGHRLRLRFIPVANGEPMVMDKTYVNPFGEDYRVGSFKVYVTNIGLSDGSSAIAAPNHECFHLLDASQPGTLVFDHGMDGRPFKSIRFQFGIDSIRNVSGAQTGALDPMNGMFWTWSTGYINAKLEGSSSFSPNADGRFVYHIGGFGGAERTQRNVVMELPGTQSWTLEKTGLSEATVLIDLERWFRSEHDLSIAQLPVSMTAGPTATRYADNIAGMFEIESIERK